MSAPFYLPFDYAHRYADTANGLLIPVALQSGQIFYKASTYIDTGASVCLFSREIGELLGLDVE